MKRLWKHEWKYYLSFMVIMTVILLLSQDISWLTEFGMGYRSWQDFQIASMLYYFSDGVIGGLLSSIVFISVIGILVFKAVFFWQEKDSYGREFLQTLPVTRLDRMVFHLAMDSLVILISVTCFGVCLYCRIMDFLKVNEIEVTGIATGIFLRMAMIIGYLLFVLCLINVLGCLFAGGSIRIAGTAGNICIGYLLLYFISILHEKSEWIQNLCRFFALDIAGNFSNTGSEELMIQNVKDIMVYYKGEPMAIPVEYDVYHFLSNEDMGLYIGCLAGYVVLAVLLAAIAIFLVGKQEQSRRDFYFAFGRYLTSGLVSVTFCTMLLLNATAAVWHACLIVLASILLFVMLSYWMDSDKRPLKKS